MSGKFKEGDLVWNKDGGIGRVELCDDKEILVVFDNGTDEIYPVGDKKTPPLLKLDPAGFWLRKREHKEEFSQAIKENPLEAALAFEKDGLVRFSLSEMKNEFIPDLISPEEWDEWQKNTLEILKEDPRFEVHKNKKIEYKGDLTALADDLLLKFRKARSLKEKQRIGREMKKLEAKGVLVDEVKESALSFFTGTALSRMNNMGIRLEALFFLPELDQEEFECIKEQLFDEIESMDSESAAEALANTSDATVRAKLLELFKERKPDEFIHICTQMCKRFKKQQRDWTLDTLLAHEDKEPIMTILDTTMANIMTNLQPFVWLSRKAILAPEGI